MNRDQIKLNFLEEAQDCFNTVESKILDISATIAETEKLDLILREVHSVKGGAGMMGFMALNQVAHRLEDFLKVLRVHHHSKHIDLEVENLLLSAVDAMVIIKDSYLKGEEVSQHWLEREINPIFEGLKEYLGELRDEDEDLLFKQQDEESSGELQMFEEGVDTILDDFETQINDLSGEALASGVVMTAEKILMYARMADLEPVINLSESVKQRVISTSQDHIVDLAQEALKVWRRSHGLVMRGNLDKLPWDLESLPIENNSITPDLDFELGDDDLLSLSNALDEVVDFDLPLENDDLLSLSNALDEVVDFDLPLENDNSVAQFSEDFLALESLGKDIEEAMEDAFAEVFEDTSSPEEELISTPEPQIIKVAPQTGKMVKVPVEQLSQFNALFGKLILERNRLNLRLEQIRAFGDLMQRRMNQLERSNKELRDWYDRASSEGWIDEQDSTVVSSLNEQSLVTKATLEDFDTLEMDRYSDLHVISQEQIETIVQLKEVSTDVNFSIGDINQALQELNHTMESLQKNATRIQMRPFADLVRGFPRFIRDLGIQFGKKVNLKIEGETTLLDRTFIEALNAPLTHLLRNAFDHGIEDPQARVLAGKPAQGTITLSAFNRGTKIMVTIQDDGAGIPLEKISQRLLKMGISGAEIAKMKPSQIMDYIFEPGFSTASEVTELSGRGVGMDIVRSNIEELQGEIHAYSTPGEGTTFTLSLPFNLSILQVMLVETQQMVFAVPVNSVREIIKCPESVEQKRVSWQNQIIPVVRMEDFLIFNRPSKPFEMPGYPVIEKPTLLIVGEGNNCGAIYLERYWGEQEVTIRPIETHLPLPPGFISSLVLGDGRVLPLIDPAVMLQEGIEQQNDFEPRTQMFSNDYYKGFRGDRHNTLLIVDDSINVRRYLASTLEKAGYQVEQAKDGQEAVDKLLAGISVQGVICDIEMPRLDGYGVLEEIKGKSQFNSLPIIMLTSRSNEKHKKLAFNLGANGYFSKPYNEEELLKTIEKLVKVNYL
ncbi:response regulator [Cyanobacterium sp. IPPAS B-1200]|uniref:hybrid sensor histidine kinase/response regulator n=1 Tax=Cyanobacterium sp. IPPAS B-1200 TaxID=1562720 RepID=UPI000852472B|nr:hybrid sensor histidine kinase/response regulator [Cyanobacterium sp. IPPAS B-1200]OEJ79476.1 hybrid sensor histidine kinase/response regulator [Cyanobacterium sp. IPPAS B-1200]